jgi:predicted transposase/invertase (TIGR01784 family)
MKTDSLFYRLFVTFPGLLFELMDAPELPADRYQVKSVEVKDTQLTLDGLWLPPEDMEEASLLFVEVQFQRDEALYFRLSTEIMMYLRQYRPGRRWQGVVVYPSTRTDTGLPVELQCLDTVIQRIYLDQLPLSPSESLGVSLIRLIVEPSETAAAAARALATRTRTLKLDQAIQQQWLELLELVVIYKYPNLSREDIEAMLGLDELKQTRFYQEARQEGRQEGRQDAQRQWLARERAHLVRLAGKRFGETTATKLAPLLDPVDTPEQLDEVYEWLLEASNGEALVQTVKVHFRKG